eukprot:14882-Pelagococcus_subviridis.AAC.6
MSCVRRDGHRRDGRRDRDGTVVRLSTVFRLRVRRRSCVLLQRVDEHDAQRRDRDEYRHRGDAVQDQKPERVPVHLLLFVPVAFLRDADVRGVASEPRGLVRDGGVSRRAPLSPRRRRRVVLQPRPRPELVQELLHDEHVRGHLPRVDRLERGDFLVRADAGLVLDAVSLAAIHESRVLDRERESHLVEVHLALDVQELEVVFDLRDRGFDLRGVVVRGGRGGRRGGRVLALRARDRERRRFTAGARREA